MFFKTAARFIWNRIWNVTVHILLRCAQPCIMPFKIACQFCHTTLWARQARTRRAKHVSQGVSTFHTWSTTNLDFHSALQWCRRRLLVMHYFFQFLFQTWQCTVPPPPPTFRNKNCTLWLVMHYLKFRADLHHSVLFDFVFWSCCCHHLDYSL